MLRASLRVGSTPWQAAQAEVVAGMVRGLASPLRGLRSGAHLDLEVATSGGDHVRCLVFAEEREVSRPAAVEDLVDQLLRVSLGFDCVRSAACLLRSLATLLPLD